MKVLYIDPQSIYNLAQYDYNLLNNVNAEITYCCNVKYDAKILDKVNYKYVFGYSEYSLQALKALSYIISIFKIMLIVCKVRPDVIHIQWWRLWFIDYIVLSYFKNIVAVLYLQSIMLCHMIVALHIKSVALNIITKLIN